MCRGYVALCEGKVTKFWPMQSSRQLFGGAMRCIVPSSMRDQSLLIPVPDHQEVFLDHSTGECLIVEIVEHNEGSPREVCRLYVDDLGQLNEATSVRDFACDTSEGLEATPAMRERLAALPGMVGCRSLTCSCTMDLPKDGNGVAFRMLVLQLPEHGADVLVSVRRSTATTSGTGSDTPTFENALKSFLIVDFSLFRGVS